MTELAFLKMHGAGNDFVVLDGLSSPLPDTFDFAAAALSLCAPHFGIGADGLLLLAPSDADAALAGAQVRMRMWNPDGSEDMCGNGLRCVAQLAYARGHVSSRNFIVQTRAGLRAAEVLPDGRVRVAMGHPQFDRAAIPMQRPGDDAGHGDDAGPDDDADAIEYSLRVAGAHIPHVTSLSTGSTHTVIFTDGIVDEATFTQLSPLIEQHAWFPERTSILWACVEDTRHLRLRIWERGVGETLACGTGACAAAVAAQVTGRCGEHVAAASRGGVLEIEWRPGSEIFMTGPAQSVFSGQTKENTSWRPVSMP
ncbi:MAG TPA: diaminopimelate epimerase [Abditibacteriaceae bacterium]|nr:diaminopimelate epimerase [Abditibacteriaceae bacterium]